MHHFEQQHPKSPDIHPIVIIALENHLRSHILVSTTECRPLDVDIESTPAEIAQFEVEVVIEQQVFRLSLATNIP